MNTDMRWRQRLNSFHQSLENLDVVYQRAQDHELDRVELQALIKSFELSYETGWNLIKDWLEYQGVTGISGSRDAIRKGFNAGLVSNGSGWMDMLQTRNRTAHTYNEGVAREVARLVVDQFYPVLHELASAMDARAAEEGASEVTGISGLRGEENQAIRAVFSGYPAVRHVVVYGSRAKGTHNPGSDIDLSIRESDVDAELMSRIETSLDDLGLPYLIDLSVYDQIENLELREHIDRVGVSFYRAP
ncbi:MAG: HI0074 family nucleotidyltransferase substrate-binding subunit [Spirochaeta sp.]|jgi:nucleotidyltransferase substrate binding protein (TIGR01987 family)|nr:HI0074 family nucleotidyltransferase substrate-binding subunit [Spirochaeta sp.]